MKYFDQDAYLSQSAQLYLEAMITSLEKVWSLTPSFRAEKSRTRRHLAEYWHLEEEAAWTNSTKNMEIQEELVFNILQKVLEKHEEDLKSLGRNVEFLKKIKLPFPRITYTEALEILEKKGVKLKWGEDMGVEEERILTQEFDRPFFVTCYPKDLKAFYMKENPDNPKTVLNNDMLAPEGFGEIIGGSERETDLNKLIERIKKDGGDPKNYDWYLDLRRFGSVPHSGFGLGTERLVMWICGLEHIRDAIPFPRVINRVYP